MKKEFLAVIPLLLASAGLAGADQYSGGGYWTDSQGQPVTDRWGNCIKSGQWYAGTSAPDGCDDAQLLAALKHVSLSSETTFAFDSATLKDNGKKQLGDIAKQITSLDEQITDVRVAGHTDSVGDDDYNMDLSMRRAQAVSDYLVAQGVDADKIQAQGFGKTQPIADNGTAEGRKQNRRVEIRVESKE